MELTLSHFINQLGSIGGISRCGQPGFCLLFALWDKAAQLNSPRFSISNMELASRAGFASNRRFFEVRKVLKDEGFLEFESVKGYKSLSYYCLNTGFSGIVENSTVNTTENGMDSSIDNSMDSSMDSSIDSSIDSSTDSSIDNSTDNGIKSLIESFCKRTSS